MPTKIPIWKVTQVWMLNAILEFSMDSVALQCLFSNLHKKQLKGKVDKKWNITSSQLFIFITNKLWLRILNLNESWAKKDKWMIKKTNGRKANTKDNSQFVYSA